jgi:hypothetical protein
MLHLCEVGHEGGIGPVLGADELAAQDALSVDDVGFGDLDGAVEGVDALVFVADGDEIDVVVDEELAVDVGVLIHADGDDFEAGHLFVEGEEAGEFFDAGSAPGGPEIEDDDAAAQLAEIDGVGGVADDELGGGFADVGGMTAAVAAGEQEGCEDETCPDFRHSALHFL